MRGLPAKGIIVSMLAVTVAVGYMAFVIDSAPTQAQMALMMDAAVVEGRHVNRPNDLQCLIPINVSAGAISQKAVRVILGAEDREFLDRKDLWGVSLRGVIGSVMSTIGGHPRGGSGISQQLVKNLFFVSSDNRFTRKFKELPLSILMNFRFKREKIIEAYLNHIPFRHGVYGIESASQYYFGKHASELNWEEGAEIEVMLANPDNDVNSSNVIRRALTYKKAKRLLKILVEKGRIPESALHDRANKSDEHDSGSVECRYIRDHVWHEILQVVYEGRKLQDDLLGRDFRIFLTIDPSRQFLAQKVVDNFQEPLSRMGGSEIAFVDLARNGGVRALVGGVDYASSQIDHVLDDRRSPGSLGKVIVLGEACEQGWTLRSQALDLPQSNGWPKDDDNSYKGKITVREGFTHSRNALMVNVAQQIGPAKVAIRAQLFGIKDNLPVENGGSAVGNFHASLQEITNMMSEIAGGGYQSKPHIIEVIFGENGKKMFSWHEEKPSVVLSTRCVRMMDVALRDVVEFGTGVRADIDRARGKTGTTNLYRDGWFAGYTKSATVGVWVGNDDYKSMNHVEGGGIPAEVFRQYIKSTDERYNREIASR